MITFKIHICIAIFFLSISQCVIAQQDPKKFDPSLTLHIGDAFTGPKKIAWMRGELKSINWKAWYDRVIVLDFFDTYCTTCIQSMPHLQQLQRQFGEKVQILNVTWQDKATLDKFFAANEYLREHMVNLPVVYNDKTLRSMFPYHAAPHLAIIYRGKVQAITFNRLLTAENIGKLLREGAIQLPLKNDFGKGDLVSATETGEIGVWLSGYQNGVRGQPLKFEKDSLSGLFKTSIYNRSIYTSLVNTWGKVRPKTFLLRPERIIWNVRDPGRFKNFTNVGEAWDVAHAISYERVDRIYRPDSLQAKIVLQDLHSLLGVRSYWSTKTFECLVLRKCPVQQSDKVFKNIARYEGTAVFSGFLAFVESFPLVFDEVRSDVTLEIGSFNNVNELNEQLRQYGFQLEEGKAEFETFVIEEDR